MSDKKQKIIDVIKNKYPDNSDILTTVNEELELMEITEGLNNRNNFDIFYEVWQRNKDKTGNKSSAFVRDNSYQKTEKFRKKLVEGWKKRKKKGWQKSNFEGK